jgi:hypothetical protein
LSLASPWSVSELRERRLSQTLAALKGNSITVVIDETGDMEKFFVIDPDYGLEIIPSPSDFCNQP